MRPDMAWELPDHTERIQSPVQRQLHSAESLSESCCINTCRAPAMLAIDLTWKGSQCGSFLLQDMQAAVSVRLVQEHNTLQQVKVRSAVQCPAPGSDSRCPNADLHLYAGGEAKQAMMLALEQSKDCSSCSCSERLLLMVWHAADAAVHQGGCHAHLHHQHFQPAVPAHRPGHNQQHWQLSSQSIHNIVTLTDVANSIIASMAAMTCSSL